MFMKRVYVSHPYLGNPENKAKVEGIIIGLMQTHKDTLFVSPMRGLGFLYKVLPYEKGMELCYELLSMCDELWLCPGWEESRGCRLEKEFAETKGMPVKFIGNSA